MTLWIKINGDIALEIQARIAELKKEFVDLRRDFHKYPEN
jgi:metal-dependent amidase/aminoacylase/carboxypeptidase family protein